MTQEQGARGDGGNLIEVPAREDFSTGAIQQFLSENIGKSVECEFLIGTQTLLEKRGYLYAVGAEYIVLTEGSEGGGDTVLCDIGALRFVTFPAAESGAETTALITEPGRSPAYADARQARQAAFNYAKRQSKGKL